MSTPPPRPPSAAGWPSGRARDGGIDRIPLPIGTGALWLCGKHVVGPDPWAALERVGADAIVCLTEAHELDDRYPDYVAWLRDSRHGRAHWHPIADLHAPPVDEALAILGVVTTRLRAGDHVVMHCAAGIGRAGTMAVGVLMMLGVDRDDAIGRVAAARPMAGPEVGAQTELVDALALAISERTVDRPPLYSHGMLDLSPDDLLTTTRAVRKRLDVDRPVPDDLIRECVAAAMQAPSGSNNPTMQFVVVRDEATRRAIGDVYRECYEIYKTLDGIYVGSIVKETDAENAQQRRVQSSADHLGEHMGDAPVLVIGCTRGRTDAAPPTAIPAMMGNILPGMWSFMLAARARGLGTAWTTVHLFQEERVADIVGIPFAEVQQVCLTPLAFTLGTDFKPAARPAPDSIIHWDRW